MESLLLIINFIHLTYNFLLFKFLNHVEFLRNDILLLDDFLYDYLLQIMLIFHLLLLLLHLLQHIIYRIYLI